MGRRSKLRPLRQMTATGSVIFPEGFVDSRKFERYAFRSPTRATIYPPVGQEDEPPHTCQVLTQDLSRGGISIIYAQPLFQSQRIELELPDGRNVTLSIRRVTRINDGRFLIGCKFVVVP